MIAEDYCSFEIAKLLKEKGFDEPIFEFYIGNKDTIRYARNKDGFRLSELDGDFYYPHITHQTAIKWLREEKNIIVNVWYNGVDWNAEYYNDEVDNFYLITDCLCNSYEDSVESALKYCLENLI